MNNATADHAEVKIFPPLFILGGIIVGIGLNTIVPFRLLNYSIAEMGGYLIMALSFCIAMSAIYAQKKGGTDIDVRSSTSTLITTGIYKISRNPMYLGAVLMFVGIALGFDNAWFLLLSILLCSILHFKAVKPEQAYLEAKFGETYTIYCEKVRPWI